MKHLRLISILSFFSLLILVTAAPENAVSAPVPARRGYHHKFHKRHKKFSRKRFNRKKRTIPKDYIIKNHRRYKVW